MQKKYAITITTRNRRADLAITLDKIDYLLKREDVECIICDDGSTDSTYEFLETLPNNISRFRNDKSRGLIFSRNRLLERVTAEYAISIDDDLHFVTANPLEIIDDYFTAHPKCALMSFRIFWNKEEPATTETDQIPERVKSFAGGAHALRVSDWRKIPDYPEWFVFYGEESFAALHMHMRDMEIHYVPQILVNHRVDMTQRKKNRDRSLRLRRSLRAGWYLYFMFMPVKVIPRKMGASIWHQFKSGLCKRDLMIFRIIVLATFDLLVATPVIIRDSHRLSQSEYENYAELADAKLYWTEERKKAKR